MISARSSHGLPSPFVTVCLLILAFLGARAFGRQRDGVKIDQWFANDSHSERNKGHVMTNCCLLTDFHSDSEGSSFQLAISACDKHDFVLIKVLACELT